jgi:TolA-binding protein
VSEHISRKELKRNEVAETLVHGAEAVAAHQRPIWIGAAVVVVIALAFFGWKFYSDRQTLKSSAALEEAMKVFNARIVLPSQPKQDPTEVTYINEQNKYEDAAKKFAEVAQKYSLAQPGHVARYYAGLSFEKLNNNDEAEKWFRETSKSSYQEIAALGKFQLAAVLARKGKNDEATKLYQELVQKPGLFTPKPVVMLTLAEHYRKTNPAEAVKLYSQVKTEYPNSAAAEEADKQLEALTPKT